VRINHWLYSCSGDKFCETLTFTVVGFLARRWEDLFEDDLEEVDDVSEEADDEEEE